MIAFAIMYFGCVKEKLLDLFVILIYGKLLLSFFFFLVILNQIFYEIPLVEAISFNKSVIITLICYHLKELFVQI